MDCSAPSANPARAESTVRKTEYMLCSWYPIVAPSEEPRARHQCVGSICRLLICFCKFHNMLNHANVCFFGYAHTCRHRAVGVCLDIITCHGHQVLSSYRSHDASWIVFPWNLLCPVLIPSVRIRSYNCQR